MIYEELTSSVIAASYEVINELGSGFLESVYVKALMLVLTQKGLSARTQVPLKVRFRNEIVGEFFADILVEDKLILELKAVKFLLPEHQAQLINYLKATGIDVGLLVNFGAPKLEIRRLHS